MGIIEEAIMRWLLALTLISPAYAHNLTCDNKPVPSWIKSNCCGEADAHRLSPSQVRQDAKGNWHIDTGTVDVVVPDDKAQPAQDGCYWAFWRVDAVGHFAGPWQNGKPEVYCFLIPMGT